MNMNSIGFYPGLYTSEKPKNKKAEGKEMNQEEFQSFKEKRFNDIYAHEKAHQSVGGNLAGGIHIDTDTNGVAYAGHVPIKMPGVNEANPEKSKLDANQVKNAAMAPGDPSPQDYFVAAEAQAIMAKADLAIKNKKEV